MRRPDYDVLIATDFRHSGGTTASIAQEIEVQARMGLRTGLLQIDSAYLASAPWSDRIQNLVGAGLAEPLSPHREVTAHLLVLRHPRVFEHDGWRIAARADHVVMVANQLPKDDAKETPYYDVDTVLARLDAELGGMPPWAPIGPMVRDSLVAWGSPRLELLPRDWYNVINADAWTPRQPRARREIGVIGRHSRDDHKKWPEDRAGLLGAYPDSPDVRVRILGGAVSASKVLGRIPRNWEVLPFGSVAPEEFLAGIDVYAYFHHSGWREAFGRAPLEALASGLHVATHPYLERLFGDACRYVEPRDATAVLHELLAQRGAPNQRGIEVVRDRYDWDEHRRRLERYLPRPLSTVKRTTRARRVLFTSSNGSGLGHLTRLLAIARRLPADVEPRFLTQSTGIQAVRKLGYWVDYVPSRTRAAMAPTIWHDYLRSRVSAALRAFRPDAVVFDGTYPYGGLLQAMSEYPQVHRVWCRRAMWKDIPRERVRKSYEHLSQFDLVLEPGELAAEADDGITARQRHLVRGVDPIVLLREEEVLSREAARAELGIAPGSVAVLFNLGAGNINRIDLVYEAVAGMLSRHPDVHLLAVQSMIARSGLLVDSARVTRLEIYPLGRVLRAFDFCIAAPGYNSFHELLATGVPTLFVPNEKTEVDDQLARAVWASERGVALMSCEDDVAGLARGLEAMTDPERRAALARRCAELRPADGAQQAADAILAQVEAPPRRVAADRARDIAPPWRVKRRFGRRPPVVTAAPLRLPPRPPSAATRALMVADRLQAGAAGVEELIGWAGSQLAPPVVVTSAEALPSLSRLGVDVELWNDQTPDDVADRLDFAAYGRLKARAMMDAYGCGPVLFWDDGAPRDTLPTLFLLGV